MNVHGPSHEAFYKARDKYEGRRGVIFMSVGEALDADGAPIVVGEGEPLPPKAQARKKVLPLTKVCARMRVGVRFRGRGKGGLETHSLLVRERECFCNGTEACVFTRVFFFS